MNKQINILAKTLEEVSEGESKEYFKIYFDFVEILKTYFETQSKIYIKSLYDYIEIKKIEDTEQEEAENDMIEETAIILSSLYLLAGKEQTKSVNLDLARIGEIGIDFSENTFKQYATEYAENRAGELISGINETTEKQISSIITKGIDTEKTLKEISKDIKEKFSDFSIYRANLIAQQETKTAYSEASHRQFTEVAETYNTKGWKRSKTQKDDKVRPSHKANEEEGWIQADQVYGGTGTLLAPHGFGCRCRDIHNIFNPETGSLSEEVYFNGYSDEQVDNFHNHFGKENIKFSKKAENIIKDYNLTEQEALAIKYFTGNAYNNFNNGYKKGTTDEMFQSGIKFLFGGLSKLPKTKGTFYRGHQVSKKGFENLEKLGIGESFSLDSFFSSSKNKKIAEDFMGSDNKVLIKTKTKKAINIKDFSFLETEEEVVFMPKTLFSIEKVEKINNILEITLTDL